MPQKKNPDIAELIRGKTGRVYGSLISMLTVMKGLSLSYNRDMQEDKAALFDTVDTVLTVLELLPEMIQTMDIYPDRMLEACLDGFLNATDVADYLVKKQVPFRTAHGIVAKTVDYCIQHNKRLDQLTMEELKMFSDIFEEDVFPIMDIKQVVQTRTSLGGTAPTEVRQALHRSKS